MNEEQAERKRLATEFLYRSSYFRIPELIHRKLRRRKPERLPNPQQQFIERKNPEIDPRIRPR